jgi:hypothetical protein
VWGIPNPDDLLTYDSRTYLLMLERLAEEHEARRNAK